MVYTQDMFIRDYEPEWHEKIQAARMEGWKEGWKKGWKEGWKKGREEGRKEGELLGKIRLLQQILGQEPVSSDEDLAGITPEDLEKLFESLRTAFEQQGGHRKV